MIAIIAGVPLHFSFKIDREVVEYSMMSGSGAKILPSAHIEKSNYHCKYLMFEFFFI